MTALSSVSDLELRERLSAAVSTERVAAADVVYHLAELDRRKLYLEDACSSLFAYCVDRLGYSEDGANKRVRVARLVQRFPRVLDELASGEVHLTGLRAERERDGDQCTFRDAKGRRCSERRFLTIEHTHPFAQGGPTTVENCCLLCQGHNAFRAREVFGEEHIQQKIAEARARHAAHSAPVEGPEPPDPAARAAPDVFEKVRSGLVRLGFKRAQAERAVQQLRVRGVEPRPEPLLRAAIAVLTA